MAGFSIRNIAKQDIAGIRALYVHLLDESFGNLPAEALEFYKADWTEELIAARLEDPRRVLVAAFDSADSPIGYALCAPPDGGVATIIWLAMHRSRRGRGIGRGLTEVVCSEFRGMGCHKLRLFAMTRDAIRFYEKLGMRTEGEHPNYWWRQRFWSLGMDL